MDDVTDGQVIQSHIQTLDGIVQNEAAGNEETKLNPQQQEE